MTGKTMMAAAIALATAMAVPAIAQQTTSGAPDPTANPTTRSPGMVGNPDGTAMQTPTKLMTDRQATAWRKCQAMDHDRMMKSKSCMKLSKMNGGMTPDTM